MDPQRTDHLARRERCHMTDLETLLCEGPRESGQFTSWDGKRTIEYAIRLLSPGELEALKITRAKYLAGEGIHDCTPANADIAQGAHSGKGCTRPGDRKTASIAGDLAANPGTSHRALPASLHQTRGPRAAYRYGAWRPGRRDCQICKKTRDRAAPHFGRLSTTKLYWPALLLWRISASRGSDKPLART